VFENIDYNNLNYLDITLVSLLVILAIKGFVNGFLKELFGVIGLVGGIFLASKEYLQVAQYIDQKISPIENQALLNLTGFVAIAIGFWILSSIVGIIVSYFANKNSKMGLVSRLMGMAMSGGKYALLFAVVIVSLLNIPLIKESVEPRLDLNNSKLYPYIKEYGNEVINLEAMRIVHPKSFENVIQTKEIESVPQKENNITAESNSSKSEKSNMNSIIVTEQ